MPTKHARCSASAAYRWINCPGSVALSDQCPDPGSSSYADEGTVAHSLAELKLRHVLHEITDAQYKFQSTCPARGTTANMHNFFVQICARVTNIPLKGMPYLQKTYVSI